MSEAPAFTLEVVTRPEDLQSLAADWRALDEVVTRPVIFLTWEWMEAWLHAVEWRRNLHVIVLRDAGGSVAAIAPMMIGADGALDRGDRIVGFLGSEGPQGGTYLDLIARPGWEGAAHLAVMRHLAEGMKGYSYVNLNRVAVDEPTLNHWLAAGLECDLHATVDLRRRTVWMPLPGTYAEFIASVSNPRWRQRIRNYPGALVRDHPSAVWSDRAQERPLDPLLDDFRRLQELRWDQDGGSYYRRPGYDRYMRRVCANMQERGRLRALTLTIAGRTVSCRLGLVHRGTWLDFQTGWDPAFAKQEISHQNLWHCVERAIEEGLSRMDSLDEYDYKRRYFRHTRWVADLRFYDDRPASAGRQMWRAGGRAGRRLIRDLTPKRLRSLLRR